MRERNKQIANETLEAIQKGEVTIQQKTIDLKSKVDYTVSQTKLFSETQLTDPVAQEGTNPEGKTVVTVVGETTLQGAERLARKYDKVAVLNFASAKNPGGGFLNGSSAQEESIARSSTLYASLEKQKEFYDAHRKIGTALYSDRMIYSPKVTVFKKDNGELIEPYDIDVITSAAVNAGVVKERGNKEEIKQINTVMEQRIYKVLHLAKQEKVEALVLGAFGCGVFKNDPNVVAELFRRALKKPEFQGAFKEIVFSIYEQRGESKIKRIFEIKMK